MGSSALGIYQMAYKISILPITEVSDVISQVVFPVYTKIEGDIKRLIKAYIKTMLVIFVGTLTIGMLVFIFPTEIVRLILGPQWLSAVPVLKILAIYGILRSIAGPSSALFLSRGKQNYITAMTFIRFLTLIITIYPLILMYGMIGAGYSALISVLAEFPVIIYFIFKILRSKE